MEPGSGRDFRVAGLFFFLVVGVVAAFVVAAFLAAVAFAGVLFLAVTSEADLIRVGVLGGPAAVVAAAAAAAAVFLGLGLGFFLGDGVTAAGNSVSSTLTRLVARALLLFSSSSGEALFLADIAVVVAVVMAAV